MNRQSQAVDHCGNPLAHLYSHTSAVFLTTKNRPLHSMFTAQRIGGNC